MINLVLIGLVAFLLSLGGTAGAMIVRAKKHATAPTSHAAADSSSAVAVAGHAHAGAASPVTLPAAPDLSAHGSAKANHGAESVAAGIDTVPAAPLPTRRAALPVRAAPVKDSVSASHVGQKDAPKKAVPQRLPADKAAAYRQLARIFANMKTADAARVLAYMSDDETQGVIEQLGVRQAATLLSNLPKERAALLSRRLLSVDPATPQ